MSMKPMKTPGVYIKEKNAFPNSVVQVATAVPAFIGYTQNAENGNKTLENVPWRISSMSEFTKYFGGPPTVQFDITKRKAASDSDDTRLSAGGVAMKDPLPIAEFTETGDGEVKTHYDIGQVGDAYALYGAIRLFFQNGGGACYIVSIGSYKKPITSNAMLDGIKLLLKEPEPTMLVIPETTRLTRGNAIKVQQAMLKHCDKMKSRIAILDIFSGYLDRQDQVGDPVKTFRSELGVNGLDYGTAYYPWVKTSIFDSREFTYENLSDTGKIKLTELLSAQSDDEEEIKTLKWITAKPADPTASQDAVSAGEDAEKATETAGEAKEEAGKAVADGAESDVKVTAAKTAAKKAGEAALAAASSAAKASESIKKTKAAWDLDKANEAKVEAATAAADTAAKKAAKAADAAAAAATKATEAAKLPDDADSPEKADAAAKAASDASIAAEAAIQAATAAQNAALIAAEAGAEAETNAPATAETDVPSVPPPTPTSLDNTLRVISPLYKQIMDEIAERMNCMPPAAAMAGVYTAVDADRGVWKAPANVSLNSVTAPTVNISHEEQEDLNVTPQGKSINAIRPFIGEGTLVWGARTLDGNSLDWRYINVRRTMIMLEESIRLASKAYVFEPNTANTWITMKSMIENFLTGIWKQGGLPGAVPEDAFSVHVGLGDTMTPVDILEGILKITVLVAISRPAEFIEITFQQQMQKS